MEVNPLYQIILPVAFIPKKQDMHLLAINVVLYKIKNIFIY